jgi:hypothetical protein
VDDQASRQKKTSFGSIFAKMHNGWLSFIGLLSRLFERLTGKGWSKKANTMKEEIKGQQEELQQSSAAFDDIVKNTERNIQQTREKAGFDEPEIGEKGQSDTALFSGNDSTQELPKEPEAGEASETVEEAGDAPDAVSEVGAKEALEGVSEDNEQANASSGTHEGDVIPRNEGTQIVPIGLFFKGALASGKSEFANPLSNDYWRSFGGQANDHAWESFQRESLQSGLLEALQEKRIEDLTSAFFEIRAATLGKSLGQLLTFNTSGDMLTVALHGLWQDSEKAVAGLMESPENLSALIDQLTKGEIDTLWGIAAAQTDGFIDGIEETPGYEEQTAAKAWCEEQYKCYEKAIAENNLFVEWAGDENWVNEEAILKEAPASEHTNGGAEHLAANVGTKNISGISDALGAEGELETLNDPVEGFSSQEEQSKANSKPEEPEKPHRDKRNNKYEYLYDHAGEDLFNEDNFTF